MDKRKEQRRKNAEELKAKSDVLTPLQKLQKLDAKLGVGVGAKRERKRLQTLIDKK